MKLLKDYFELQKQIHDFFGYVEYWKTIPLEDCTDSVWCISEEGEDGEVFYADSMEGFESGKCYSGQIYTQRFLPKYVYRADGFTMVSVDTQCDGNKYLMVFDNTKEFPYNEDIVNAWDKE